MEVSGPVPRLARSWMLTERALGRKSGLDHPLRLWVCRKKIVTTFFAIFPEKKKIA
jgi:hypothetical protein